MKIILFAAALSLGSAGLAQTGNTVSDPSQASGPRGVTQQSTDPEGQACTPVGYNAGVSAYPPCEAWTGSAASPGAPPRCTRIFTDHCVQAYERQRPICPNKYNPRCPQMEKYRLGED